MGPRAEAIERRFERPMLGAAALVIPALVLEGSADHTPGPTIALVLDWVIWIAFAAELVTMLVVVEDRRSYLGHNP
jgi:hypothetical protein